MIMMMIIMTRRSRKAKDKDNNDHAVDSNALACFVEGIKNQ